LKTRPKQLLDYLPLDIALSSQVKYLHDEIEPGINESKPQNKPGQAPNNWLGCKCLPGTNVLAFIPMPNNHAKSKIFGTFKHEKNVQSDLAPKKDLNALNSNF